MPPPRLPGFAAGRLLAHGGQGTVWHARRISDGLAACIKVAHAADRRAWRRECELMRSAAPIAPAWLGDGELDDGRAWLAMAYVAGDTLGQRMAARAAPYACDEVAVLLGAITDALAQLHARGIVHGDLKPENIVLGDHGATLLDFGSARRVADTQGPPTEGTAEYLAPERCTAASCCGPAADLYAVAVITYELLAGAPPFWGAAELVHEAHRSRRPPRLQALGLDPAIDDVLATALAKDPVRRGGDVASLAAKLVAVLNAAGPAVATDPRGDPRGRASAHHREKMTLLWLRTATPVAALHAAVAMHGGTVVQVRGELMVVAFPARRSSRPPRSALAAADALIAAGLCTRALIDVELVSRREHRASIHVLCPSFADHARYPGDDDPVGVTLTRAAADRVPDVATLSCAHRSDRLARADARSLAHAQAIARPTLQGRDDVLAQVAAAAPAVARGLATLVTCRGDPGSGRTRITEELCTRIASGGALDVLALRAPAEAADDVGGCVALLARALLEPPRAPPEDPRGWLSARLGAAARDHHTGLRLALGWISVDDPELAAMRAAPGAIRSAIAMALAELLIARARTHPFALLIDDADRAEPALLDICEAATLAERGAALLVVLVGGPRLAADRSGHGSRAGASLVLELAPLATLATAAIARELLAPARNVSDDAIALIQQRTRGTPLLVVELVRVLRAAGAVRPSEHGSGCTFAVEVLQRLPEVPLGELLAERELARLPTELVRHAAFVAVLGVELDLDLHAAVLDALERSDAPLPTQLDPWVAHARLVQAAVLQPYGDGFAFRHAALGERAAAELDRGQLAGLHAAAYHVLRTHGPAHPGAMVRHAWGAGLRAAAIEHTCALALACGRRHDYLDAEHHHARVLAELDHDDPRYWTALHGRGLARFRLGRHVEARADLDRVAAAAEHRGDAVQQIYALLDAATVADWCEDIAHAEALVARATSLAASTSDPLLNARLALAVGRVEFRRGRIPEATAQLERAAAMAEPLGDDAYETRVIALLLLAPLLGMVGEVERSIPLFDTLFALCRAHGDRVHLASAYLNRPYVWMELQRFDALRADLEQVIEISRSTGFPLLESRARYNLGEIAYLGGDLDEAERHADHVIELQRQLDGDGASVRIAILLVARCRARRGELARASAAVAQIRDAQAQAHQSGSAGFELAASDEVLCTMVELCCRRADASAWNQLIERSQSDSVQQEHLEVLELAALAAATRGEPELGEQLLGRALELAAASVNMMAPRLHAALAEIHGARARRAG